MNPTNPQNLVGVYQQDRWSDGVAKAQGTAVSFDGGASWSAHAVPFSECAGGNPDFDRTTDPWVTFDPNGNAYQISLPVSADLEKSAVAVSKSTDGGLSWDAPKTLIRDETALNFNDKESITADPTRPGFVRGVGSRHLPQRQDGPDRHAALFAYRGQPMFSRTTNAGATWSTPVGMASSNIFTIGNQVVVEPDGMADVFALFRGSGVQLSPNQFAEAVMISKDAGRTWSQPIKIANISLIPLRDPFSGNLVRAGDYLPDIAVDRSSGDLYVWADALW